MKIAEQIKLYTTLWQETNALYEKWAKKHGLSYYELLVILSLADKSACKQKDICQVWQLPKQTVHTILKAFVQHGWVELTPCEDDRRNKTIRLTPIGEKTSVQLPVNYSAANGLSGKSSVRSGQMR